MKSDPQTSIKVDIMNACSVCKVKVCHVPSFHRCYYMVGYYYMADYTDIDPIKVTAAPIKLLTDTWHITSLEN